MAATGANSLRGLFSLTRRLRQSFLRQAAREVSHMMVRAVEKPPTADFAIAPLVRTRIFM